MFGVNRIDEKLGVMMAQCLEAGVPFAVTILHGVTQLTMKAGEREWSLWRGCV